MLNVSFSIFQRDRPPRITSYTVASVNEKSVIQANDCQVFFFPFFPGRDNSEYSNTLTNVSLLDAFGASERLTIWCMLETPLGILYAREIAAAGPRLAALVLGTSDLTKDLHALPTHDRLPLLTSLSIAILAARAHGLAVLDGVHLDLADDEGFVAACRQGRELGFDGKTLIHPKQIAAANAAFAPTKEEVEWSRRIIAAHSEAAAAGKGVVLVEGRLIENLHVENARRLLALADEIERLSGEK